MRRLSCCLVFVHLAAASPPPAPKTFVSIQGDRWFLNGRVTYRGAPAEGRLLNVRMVNATFEDRHRPEFDADANTARFLAQLPAYVAAGVRAFTLNLQGGMPGYEGALNSAYRPDGSLRPGYLARVERVIRAADAHGAAIVLGCFYQRQDQVLRDATAVRAGLRNAASWVRDRGFRNVVLEVANEFPHGGFDHELLRSPAGQVELMRSARQTAPGLLVSTSGLGNGRLPDVVAAAADFLLIHFNGTPVGEIPTRLAALSRFGKPIVCNEDPKRGAEGARALTLCVERGASWGFLHNQLNQYRPFEFHGPADDPVVYAAFRRLAGLGGEGSERSGGNQLWAPTPQTGEADAHRSPTLLPLDTGCLGGRRIIAPAGGTAYRANVVFCPTFLRGGG